MLKIKHCLDTGAGQVLQNIYSVVIASVQRRTSFPFYTPAIREDKWSPKIRDSHNIIAHVSTCRICDFGVEASTDDDGNEMRVDVYDVPA